MVPRRETPEAPTMGAGHKLTPADVVMIRRSRSSLDDLARRFGVHRRTVYRVLIGETWKSVA
jgi:hypothetical protein